MLIKCPKCGVYYQIEKGFLTSEKRKVRCAKCAEIWEIDEKDAVSEDVMEEGAEVYNLSAPSKNEEEKVPQDKEQENDKQETEAVFQIRNNEGQLDAEKTELTAIEDSEKKEDTDAASSEIDDKDLALGSDMQQIFSRLNKQTEEIKEFEKNTPTIKRGYAFFRQNFWDKTGLRNSVLITAILLIIISLLSFRYDITRKVPTMEKLYTSIGLQSRIIGEGLEFQNVSHREYEEDYVRKMEIKGFITNTTAEKMNIPQISVEVLDKDGVTLQRINTKTPIAEIWPKERAAFSFVITQPSPLSKYVYMTFEE